MTNLASCHLGQGVFNSRSTSLDCEKGEVTPFTVMSYNIRLGIGLVPVQGALYDMPWGQNIGAIINEIRSVNPDIIGLQEVAGIDQARELGEALQMNYAYVGHETPRPGGSWWGVAILSKYPILESNGVELSFDPGNQKSMIVSTLTMADKRVTILNVHKDKDLYDGVSIKRIMERVSEIKGPSILVGDFNIAPDESNGRLELVKIKFSDTAELLDTKKVEEVKKIGTSIRSNRRIDYVFINPNFFNVEDVGVTVQSPEQVPASDHRAPYARLSWK
ncbi:MAG: endonuclease/exonuclease/phosphatase family protein [Rhodospirillaceae bacterium]